jgi:hypothetical protein
MYACSYSQSTYQELYSGPYVRGYSPTYVNFPSGTKCQNDFEYLEICVSEYPNKPPLLYSRTQGAIYVEFCQTQECVRKSLF